MSAKISHLLLAMLLISPFGGSLLFAQQEDSGFNFTTTIELGAKTFNEGGEAVTYNMTSFAPDISFGKVGIGLYLSIHYKEDFKIREADWIPDPENNRSFLDLYLPIFRYVRYGQQGDPLYGKIGTIDDGTLGNGFLIKNYSNALFMPERRIVGLALNIDGSLLNFPYLGLETFTGNLARFDLFGVRLYSRPAGGTSIPFLKDLQIGFSYAADFVPDAYYDFQSADPDAVSMLGLDFVQPLLGRDILSLALFGDLGVQTGGDNPATGGMVGLGGSFVGFINYGVSALFLGDNFLPFYFDATYDLYRESKYAVYSGEANVDGYVGWMTNLGFSLLTDAIVFSSVLDGSFTPDNSSEEAKVATYPHLRATFTVVEGVFPGFYFDAFYDKRAIASFDDLIDPTNATIGANINYKTGPAVITLGYNLRYNPEDGEWETTSRLTSSISF